MNRRQYLAVVGGSIALAGCSEGDGPNIGDGNQQTPTPESTSTTQTPEPTATPQPASFELVSATAPDSVEIGEPFTFTFEVRNTGSQSGTFETEIHEKEAGQTWGSIGSVDEEIPPGRRMTVTIEREFDHLTTASLRIPAFGTVLQTQVVGKQLTFGESHTISNGIRIQVRDVILRSAIEYEDAFGDTEKETPSGGGQYAFVQLTAKNTAGEPAYAPTSGEFDIVSGNSQFDSAILFHEPQGVGDRYDGGQLQAEIIREGYIPFEIDADLDLTDLQIVWTDSLLSGDVTVYWASDWD